MYTVYSPVKLPLYCLVAAHSTHFVTGVRSGLVPPADALALERLIRRERWLDCRVVPRVRRYLLGRSVRMRKTPNYG